MITAFAFAVSLAICASPAIANTILVTGLGDALSNNGVCTLREAIINANNDAATWPDCAAGSGADIIKLPAGTITLSIPNTPSSFSAEDQSLRGDLDILSSLTIEGNPAGSTINGGALDRIFDINPQAGNNPPAIVVYINDLTITNGRQNDVGAIKVEPNASVTMRDCTVSNSVSWANDAGGIGVLSGGKLTMVNCTVSGNSSLLLAGGIKNEGTLSLTDCTVTHNSTFGVTPKRGQGIGSYGTAVILRNTIVAANVSGRPDLEGSFDSHGYNIIGIINDGVNNIATITPNPGTADQIGVTAAQVHLGPLANNGGPTPTHALLSPSVAIDKGHSSRSITDQRGLHRPCDDPAIPNAAGGDGSDIGAFEVQDKCGKEGECCCRQVGPNFVGTCCPPKRPPVIRHHLRPRRK